LNIVVVLNNILSRDVWIITACIKSFVFNCSYLLFSVNRYLKLIFVIGSTFYSPISQTGCFLWTEKFLLQEKWFKAPQNKPLVALPNLLGRKFAVNIFRETREIGHTVLTKQQQQQQINLAYWKVRLGLLFALWN